MLTYFLAQQSDGRIVLDRECHGRYLRAIDVAEPSTIRREIEGEMVDCPQYRESFAEARAKVDEGQYRQVRGEGFFAKED
jgi:hypothetical protein